MRHVDRVVRPVVLAAIVSVTTLAGDAQQQPATVPMATLGVAGRSNAHATVAADGEFVAVAWSAAQDKATDVFIATSQDGGRTFGSPVRVNRVAGDSSLGAERPPHVAIGRRAGRRLVAVLWTARATGTAGGTAIRLAESTDDARTFGSTRIVHDEGLTGLRSWESVAIGADGTVYASWLDGRNAAAAKGASPSGGAPHGGDHSAHDGAAHTATAPRQDLFHAVVKPDGGIDERLLAADVCFCCKTATVVNAAGTVSVAWRHIFPGSERDIAVAQSKGAGAFTVPVRVSTDRWQIQACPDDGSAMAADAAGRLHVAWPTLVAGTEGQKAIFYATSSDGRTFTPRLRVDRAAGLASHPQLAVTPGGAPLLVWDEAVSGRRQVWLRMGTAKTTGRLDEPMALGTGGSGTYPAVTTTGQAAVVVWTQRAGESSTIGVSRVPLTSVTRNSN